MAELLFEIYGGEIPAKLHNKAIENLQNLFSVQALKLGVRYDRINCYITPRRLVLIVKSLNRIACDSVIEKKGPKVGSQQQAIYGFLKTHNITEQDLTIKEIKGQKFYFANIIVTEQSLQEIIVQMINYILHFFPWPKTMRWEEGNIRWIRPISNILCLLDRRVVPINLGHLIANNLSFGHYFMSKQSFTIKDAKEYKKQLESNMVVLDSQERSKTILAQAQIISDELGLQLVHDELLLEEVVGLVEYPVVLLGKIDQGFLQVPKEVLISTMRTHQKYFSLLDQKGNVAPYFIFVSNIISHKVQQIIQGNERVLRARLCDAKFFYDQDKNTTLRSRVSNLNQVVFHTKLGSVYDKTIRIIDLSNKIAEQLEYKDRAIIENAALLAKADLTTNLVIEFPELQGAIGKYYALSEGESVQVADAIFEHYLPVGRTDFCPHSIEGAILSIADKLDSICGLFSIDETPTSSKDPYGLRRNALGIIRIVIEHKLRNVNLASLIAISLALYGKASNSELTQKILRFFHERLKYFLKDQFRHDFIRAVCECHTLNIHIIYRLIGSLEEFSKTKEGKEVYAMLNRVYNFTKDCNVTHLSSEICMNYQLLSTSSEIEKKLCTEITSVVENINIARASEDFIAIFQSMYGLVELVNDFCDNVTVMVEDLKLREHRLSILLKIRFLVRDFVDLSLIEF